MSLLKSSQKFTWIEDGEFRGMLLMPNEVREFIELIETNSTSIEYGFERITGRNVTGKTDIKLEVTYYISQAI